MYSFIEFTPQTANGMNSRFCQSMKILGSFYSFNNVSLSFGGVDIFYILNLRDSHEIPVDLLRIHADIYKGEHICLLLKSGNNLYVE